ncbi:MAG: MotA/TolQ/ExbB proton channel family protein [Planctomycetota bacterium]|nr:MotA/TolQ/ExbB proton channel family protein [Planctomycetota bacterium]
MIPKKSVLPIAFLGAVCMAYPTIFLSGEEGFLPGEEAGGNPKKETPAKASGSEPSGAEPSGTVASSAEHPETYLDFALAGGYLMIPIGLCSVLWLAFLTERLVTTRRSRVLPGSFVRQVKEFGSRGDLRADEVLRLCDAHPSSAARIVRTSFERIHLPPPEIEQAVNVTAQREVHSLRRYVRLFAVLAAVTPLIGLLGTVTGMIQAFREVAIGGLGSGQALAPGIYKALVTTAGGLLVAIPCLVTYHWLMSRADNFVHELDNLVVDFVEARRVRAEPAVSAATGAPESI